MSIDKEFRVPVAEAEKNLVTTEKETPIDTEELSKKFLADEEKFNKLNSEGKQEDTKAYQETLATIKDGGQKNEKQEGEARQEKRQQFISKALQMCIDNLQASVDKKGIASWLTPKQEMTEDINGLMVYQSQERDMLSFKHLFTAPSSGKFVDSKIQKEIFVMVKDEFSPEEQKDFFTGDESSIKRGLSGVSGRTM